MLLNLRSGVDPLPLYGPFTDILFFYFLRFPYYYADGYIMGYPLLFVSGLGFSKFRISPVLNNFVFSLSFFSIGALLTNSFVSFHFSRVTFRFGEIRSSLHDACFTSFTQYSTTLPSRFYC